MKFNINNKNVNKQDNRKWTCFDGCSVVNLYVGMPFVIDGKRYLVNDFNNGIVYLTYSPIKIKC